MASHPPPPAFRIALAGQPNVGKSALLNQLTGGAKHVANWPGKTTELARGIYRHDGAEAEIEVAGSTILVVSLLL